MEIVVGTAGHIDHGKTTLVKALTGVDADRLPEEKERGITIDLGFAELRIGDVHFGFVDVPGHERFVKNMLAGATGIDLVLLVVAADEGVMPQTREHFDICRLLGVSTGLIAITKVDTVDAETLELARLDVSDLVAGSFLDGAPMIEVSAKTGVGLDQMETALISTAKEVQRKSDIAVARLPVDRSFTVKGFGTVVTGTLVSGELSAGDELETLPTGRRVRVRGLEKHGEQTATARRGSRVAVNLASIGREDIGRGMTLCEAGALRPAHIIDTRIEVLTDANAALRTRQRVRVNIGTAEVLARLSILNDVGAIEPGTSDLAQVRFESPVVALPGERFIIRSYSPAATIAGGCVIVNSAEKHRKKEFAAVRSQLESILLVLDAPEKQVAALLGFAGPRGLSFADLRSRTGIRTTVLRELLSAASTKGSIVDRGGHFADAEAFSALKHRVSAALEAFHRREPLAKGTSLEILREKALSHSTPELARAVIESLAAEGVIAIAGESVRLASHQSSLSTQETTAAESLRSTYRSAGIEVPRADEAVRDAAAVAGMSVDQTGKVLRLMVDGGELIKVSDEFYFLSETIALLTEKLRERARSAGDPVIDVPRFKDLAGVSRKYAIPLLEYFDRVQVTRRAGDRRVIIR